MKFIKDIFTDDEGDFCIVVLMATCAMLFYFVLSTYNVFWLEKSFEYVNFATGAGALVVSLGAAYKMKRKETV